MPRSPDCATAQVYPARIERATSGLQPDALPTKLRVHSAEGGTRTPSLLFVGETI